MRKDKMHLRNLLFVFKLNHINPTFKKIFNVIIFKNFMWCNQVKIITFSLHLEYIRKIFFLLIFQKRKKTIINHYALRELKSELYVFNLKVTRRDYLTFFSSTLVSPNDFWWTKAVVTFFFL